MGENAMAKTADRVREVAMSAKPYVERALQDAELRESLKRAFDAAHDVYTRLAGQRGVAGLASRVATDREIQDRLRAAIGELRHAAARLQETEPERKTHRARNVAFLLLGIALGILFNPVTGPDARRWLKSRLLPGEEGGAFAPSGNGNLG